MSRKRLIGVLLALIATLATFLVAQPGLQVTWHWTAPTTGSKAVKYVGEYQLNNTVQTIYNIPTTSLTTPYPEGGSARLRVAGVDSLGRQGSWSAWSNLLTDPGLTGPPGTPTWSIN